MSKQYPSLQGIQEALENRYSFHAKAQDLVAYMGGWDFIIGGNLIDEDDLQAANEFIENFIQTSGWEYPHYSISVIGDATSGSPVTIRYIPLSSDYKINLTKENIRDELKKTYNRDIDFELVEFGEEPSPHAMGNEAQLGEVDLHNSPYSLAEHLGIARPTFAVGSQDYDEEKYLRTLENVDIYNHNYQACDKDVINIVISKLEEEKASKERVVTTLDKALVDKIDDIKVLYKRLFNGRLDKNNQIITELIVLGLYKLDNILVDLLKDIEGTDCKLLLDLDSIDLKYYHFNFHHTSIIDMEHPLYKLTNWEDTESVLRVLKEAVIKAK